MVKRLSIGCVWVLLASSGWAQASQWSFGAAASYSPAVYQDTPSNQIVIPVIGYESDRFFMRGFSAGYRLFPARSAQNIIFRLVYDPRTLKPQDSGDVGIQQMDKRKSTVLGGVSYQLITLAGLLEATVGSDVGFVHNGLYAEAAWRLPIRQRGWTVIPSVGYAYNSSRLNEHLYGVSKEEAVRAQAVGSTISEFNAGWDGQYFIGLSGFMNLTNHLRVTGGGRYTNYEGNIEKSPLIESGIHTSANVGVTYSF